MVTLKNRLVIITKTNGLFISQLPKCMYPGLPRVREKSGKNKIFSRSGNFEKMSGNFGHLTNVREMSGNFVMTINFFLNMVGIFLLAYIFKS